ncbi:hypothetical protein [Thermoactinospora rubra]|uniref:hypothetical protein n=1 Tax=Thermoactinospora rubra TaxID=1088767 RepID=UPI00117FE416|nr:hypothetical protein [Thermoactinospora rubra]
MPRLVGRPGAAIAGLPKQPIWEAGDNILCLDVRRAMLREQTREPFPGRLQAALGQAPDGDPATVPLVGERVGDPRKAITAWPVLGQAVAEARLLPLARLVHGGRLRGGPAAGADRWERCELGGDRKAPVARRYANLTSPATAAARPRSPGRGPRPLRRPASRRLHPLTGYGPAEPAVAVMLAP